MPETSRESGALTPALFLPSDFEFGEVPSTEGSTQAPPPSPQAPSLGPLAAFTGTWHGHGFNQIFRPDSGSPTKLPIPVRSDNLLELNLVSQTLSFTRPIGTVPNRGETTPDIFLNGVGYLLTVTDITHPAKPIGIHFEPGVWMNVPATTDPPEGNTLVRMASIPHGTTLNAQGTFRTFSGPPSIPPVSITPDIGRFPSQTASDSRTARIPQDLAPFIKKGSITQAILDDPNTVLRDATAKQTILSTTALGVASNASSPLFGGGIDDIAFLDGDPNVTEPNAQIPKMASFFWIETVQHALTVPAWSPGQSPLAIRGEATHGPAPVFLVTPPSAVTTPRQLKV
ncbi:MAG TPA: heme-binding protein, partial [Gemmatimonadales bacterium]|nr:heme-binding protein [Gemmatimonadales bacterium]